jgi:hypothetical protein
MPCFIAVCGQREMRPGGESCPFELLVRHKWRRKIGPKCIGSSPRASAEGQLPMLFRARDSE